ncbi:unnamed protein product [Debaryomyces tyrocola]|nr:unnamed protein product [Debaryomyces tyrocola]
MAKKISKHSRAARRGLVEDLGEAKDLASLPKPESDDVRKSIIRTTIKNEDLLNKKMENQRIKKMNRKKTNSLKHRLERSNKVDGVLSTKIEQSIARAKYVQNSRKAAWDQINKGISTTNELVDNDESSEKSEEQAEREEEDAYVQQFFEDDSGKQKDDTSDNTSSNSNNKNMNRFALLEESEA